MKSNCSSVLRAGSLREPRATLELALLDGLDLGGEQTDEELRVAGLLALGVREGAGELVGDRGELEVVQVLAQLLVERVVTHRPAASASRA